MNEVTKPRGRPLKFQSVEELQTKIDAFFAECEAKEEPFTITGLALALDTTRQCLINYEDRPEFLDAIKRAKLRVENDYEKALRKNGRAGDIFGLKNFGWKDDANVNVGGQEDNPIRQKITVELVSAPPNT